MKNLKKLSLTIISSVLFAQAAYAATTTANLSLTATVVNTCTVTTATLAFGPYDFNQVDGQVDFDVKCTNGTNYNVSLGPGNGSGSTVTTRKMTSTSPAGTLSYFLYRDSARTLNWGNTIGTDTVTGTGTGNTVQHRVYGRIPANQTSPAGSGYTDTVTITVTF